MHQRPVGAYIVSNVPLTEYNLAYSAIVTGSIIQAYRVGHFRYSWLFTQRGEANVSSPLAVSLRSLVVRRAAYRALKMCRQACNCHTPLRCTCTSYLSLSPFSDLSPFLRHLVISLWASRQPFLQCCGSGKSQ